MIWQGKKISFKAIGGWKIAEFLFKKLFRNTLNNDLFVLGIHKVIFDDFESGITNTYEQNNNKMNANLAKVSFIKHIGFINRAN